MNSLCHDRRFPSANRFLRCNQLTVDICQAYHISIHKGKVSHAASCQCLCRKGADTANAKHCHTRLSQFFYAFPFPEAALLWKIHSIRSYHSSHSFGSLISLGSFSQGSRSYKRKIFRTMLSPPCPFNCRFAAAFASASASAVA